MLIFVDSEGEPVQEFSAIYVDPINLKIVDVFHRYVTYPLCHDEDVFSRRHVHGLDIDFLSTHGVSNEIELVTLFHQWLETHPYESIYGHAPAKEENLLSLPIEDICLKPWKDRSDCASHRTALSIKMNSVPICGVTCNAHSRYCCWKAKRSLTETDKAKMLFRHHCSLYDCVECFLFHSE